MPKLLLLLLVLVLIATAAHAEMGNPPVSRMLQMTGAGNAHMEMRQGMPMRPATGTPILPSAREDRPASSTLQGGWNKGPSTGAPSLFGGMPGVVGAVGSDTFSLTMPAMKDHATTTVTVHVSANTKFMAGTSTAASFSDITNGAHAIAIGTYSTSTKSIAATRVIVVTKVLHPLPHLEDQNGSHGFVSRFKHLFSATNGNSAGASAEASTESGVSGGLVHRVLNGLFGWI